MLNKELEKVRENVDSDGKLKKMAELQLTVVTEAKNKQVISDQVSDPSSTCQAVTKSSDFIVSYH